MTSESRPGVAPGPGVAAEPQSEPPGRTRASAALNLALIVTLAAIGLATLFPGLNGQSEKLAMCLICGNRGLSDAVLNILLFLPLGALLGFKHVSTRRIVLVASVMSVAIELLQFVIPSRDPSMGDVLANAMGAWIGAWLALHVPRFMERGEDRGTLYFARSLAAVLALLLAGAWLVQPGLPRTVYHGQWTPEFGNRELYRGQILDARIGGHRLPSTRLRDSRGIRRQLLSGLPLQVTVRAGPAPVAPAPVFNIYDHRQREVIAFDADGTDLLMRYRSRAALLRLDQPSFRMIGALQDLQPGERFQIAMSRADRGFCIDVTGRRYCPLGFTIGQLWTLLVSREALPVRLATAASLVLMLGLFSTAGFWMVRRSQVLLAVVATFLWLLLVPRLTGLLPTPPLEFAAAIMGLAAGRLLREAVQLRSAVAADSPKNAETIALRQRSIRS